MMRAAPCPGRRGRVPILPARQGLTGIELCAWITQAGPGERLVYHRGFLGIDILPVISTLPEPDRRRLAELARAARGAFGQGLVHLVQARLGPDRFAYGPLRRWRDGVWISRVHHQPRVEL